jgi:hypothetical protein
VVAAAILPRRPELALFPVAAVTLVLVFIGIHNAWDTITYLATDSAKGQEDV